MSSPYERVGGGEAPPRAGALQLASPPAPPAPARWPPPRGHAAVTRRPGRRGTQTRTRTHMSCAHNALGAATAAHKLSLYTQLQTNLSLLGSALLFLCPPTHVPLARQLLRCTLHTRGVQFSPRRCRSCAATGRVPHLAFPGSCALSLDRRARSGSRRVSSLSLAHSLRVFERKILVESRPVVSLVLLFKSAAARRTSLLRSSHNALARHSARRGAARCHPRRGAHPSSL